MTKGELDEVVVAGPDPITELVRWAIRVAQRQLQEQGAVSDVIGDPEGPEGTRPSE